MNRRRQIVLGLSAALAAAATRVCAQPATGPVRRVSVLALGDLSGVRYVFGPVYEELARVGWIEGRNVALDAAAAEGQVALLPQRAAELVARAPSVILVAVPPAAHAAMRATSAIPIVFKGIAMPIEEGLVASLARPGGNVTGVTGNAERLLPKRIQLLREILPGAKRLGILRPPREEMLDKVLAGIVPALAPLGVTIIEAPVANAAEIDAAISRLVGMRVDAIFDVHTSNATWYARDRLFDATNRARIPVVANAAWGADAGGLFAYGGSETEANLAFARVVDRILRGANPADIPVESVNAYDFVVNVRTARQFGITIPQSVLLRATRVIE